MRAISFVNATVATPIHATFHDPSQVIDHAQTDRLMRDAINRERANHGLPALEAHDALKRAAEREANDMAAHDRLDHFGSDGSNWAERCRDAGYPGASLETIGENVAGWQVSASQAVSDWRQSPGHLRAMLGNWQHVGGASATAASGRSYWVADFGRPAP